MGKYNAERWKPHATMLDAETTAAVAAAIQARGLRNRSQAVKEAIAYWLAHLDLLPRSVAAKILGKRKRQ